ncbi:hypothetical protein A2Z33_03070 [Candidatus Gottesmanbacteria bacterium RBG_16_52_11]|uniref:Uncharacterized protein n=1 Tax=Candidatus Gottesmanbacteria bacterium RBG_16_52_11 TaxID=1798374 RepID=A0A1F5YVC1_9BACT|nr:MAG: hypothetical protein A2Z33_03070 [Candidatus Gottesmanbacteria bacterium RBG_16_52_11]
MGTEETPRISTESLYGITDEPGHSEIADGENLSGSEISGAQRIESEMIIPEVTGEASHQPVTAGGQSDQMTDTEVQDHSAPQIQSAGSIPVAAGRSQTDYAQGTTRLVWRILLFAVLFGIGVVLSTVIKGYFTAVSTP